MTTGGPRPFRADARFERCFRDTYADVLAYALRRLGDRARAEEVAAETFAVAWRRREALADEPLPWLYGIAANVLRNETRSHRRIDRLRARLATQPSAAGRDPAEHVAERGAIHAALSALREGEREVLRLAAWEGLDAARAARLLGCSRAAYASRLHRARGRLAKAIASADAPPARESRVVARPANEEGGP